MSALAENQYTRFTISTTISLSLSLSLSQGRLYELSSLDSHLHCYLMVALDNSIIHR